MPSKVVCTTTEFTESDTDAGKIAPEEVKTAGFTTKVQEPYGDAEEANTEQALEAPPTVRDTVTPAGLHWLRPKESVTEYNTETVLALFSVELYTTGVLIMPTMLAGEGKVKVTPVVELSVREPIA